MNIQEELLAQLIDIEELDPIGFWPLAIGWWLLFGILILCFGMIFFLKKQRQRYLHSWVYETEQILVNLKDTIEKKSAKHIVTELSEQLRYIALRRFPRSDCASLTGEKWLLWLTKKDPKQFRWDLHGGILITGPYSPSVEEIFKHDLERLIEATDRWVKAC